MPCDGPEGIRVVISISFYASPTYCCFSSVRGHLTHILKAKASHKSLNESNP